MVRGIDFAILGVRELMLSSDEAAASFVGALCQRWRLMRITCLDRPGEEGNVRGKSAAHALSMDDWSPVTYLSSSRKTRDVMGTTRYGQKALGVDEG